MSESGTNNTALYLAQQKSVMLAVVLTFFFGPIGMLYSTVPGAVVIFLLTLAAVVLTAGIGLVVVWPISMIWAAVAVKKHNLKLVAQM